MKAVLHIEYLNDTPTKNISHTDYAQALEQQRKIMQNKKLMEQIKVLQVKTVA